MRVQNRFPLSSSAEAVEFQLEGFNVLNRTNFGAPNGDRSSNAFGTIRSTFPARQLQLAAKVIF